MTPMQPKPLSLDDLEAELIRDTQRRSPGDRILDAARLFDRTCMFMAAGIRAQHPNADETEIRRLVGDRLEIGRRLEHAA
jgi:hypothetical protein